MLVTRTVLRRRGGFTLVELMIVITILGVLVALAAPAMGNWLKNAQIRTAAEAIKSGLTKAREQTRDTHVPVEFILGTGSSWTVRLANVNTVLESRLASAGSADVVLVTTPATARTVTFTGEGRRKSSNADGTPVLTQICVDLPSTVLAAADTHDLELDITLAGEVTMCDPKVSSAADPRVCEGYPTPCTAL